MKQTKNAAVIVLGVCVAVRIGAALVAPFLPALALVVFMGALLFWLIGKR
jgi:hypothetical protein